MIFAIARLFAGRRRVFDGQGISRAILPACS